MTHLIRIVKCWSRKLALLALPVVCHATTLPPFTADTQGVLFTIKGSNTVGATLMPALAEDFLRAKGLIKVTRLPLPSANEIRVQGYVSNDLTTPPIAIDIAAHGSATGFVGLLEGSAQLAMASRPIKAKEAASLAHLGDMNSFDAEKIIAIDGLAIIVHPNNPVQALSIAQIANIFAGRISNWKAVGGLDEPITLFARDENSGTWDTFNHLVLAKRATLATTAARFESNDQLSEAVTASRGAIGFVGLASINQAKALALYDQGTEPLAPSIARVATEDYALSRRLFIYRDLTEANPLLKEFIAFMQSAQGQARVQAVGYVSQHPKIVAPDLAGVDNKDYLALVSNAQRLSVNIRFKAGSAELDNKAQQDILRLASVMSHADFSGKTPLLIGFGDAKNTESRARVLSKLRASRVKAALYALGIHTAPVAGFGAVMPIASADNPRNQRVEIWVQ
ncbi:substrate-binding domain-containing protein [Simiduia aestuariiviva]|uniref:Phosphate transport system substrate-binding protein n=1 Tax=Simiduia aestuariiviva TaxID=1510459 RepID=A0A839UQZ1_9GAMM|nr:substrate-binding domain-containing protein [Simiduia aestuariiviva]MBB3167827.1 phosphate transport system substrate-binding protein [Simiduia aestuariiviva]